MTITPSTIAGAVVVVPSPVRATFGVSMTAIAIPYLAWAACALFEELCKLFKVRILVQALDVFVVLVYVFFVPMAR